MFETRNSKIALFVSLVIFVIVVVCIYVYLNKKEEEEDASRYIKEGFAGMGSMTWRKERVIAPNPQGATDGNFYSVPANYQALLNPRFANTDFGANIRYNMPSNDHMASPCDPLTFGNMINDDFKEGYTSCNGSGCVAASCNRCGGGSSSAMNIGGAPLMGGDFTSGNYKDVLAKAAKDSPDYPDMTNMIPVGDMTTLNSLGETVQPVIYDRFVYANRNSRLRSQGDPIRGDLPIVPCQSDWFRPSVHPTIDLQEGAMNVLAGPDNSTTRALAALIEATSGKSTIAGVDLSADRSIEANQALGTINVTAFQ